MRLEHRFVEEIPAILDGGVLYASIAHRTTIHLCCCGCGNEVVLPLDPAEWKLTFDGESVSMHPSVGNWSFPCRSHYWIRRGHIQWAEQWSDEQIAAGMAHEHRRRMIRLPNEPEASAPKASVTAANNNSSLYRGFIGYIRSIWRSLFG